MLSSGRFSSRHSSSIYSSPHFPHFSSHSPSHPFKCFVPFLRYAALALDPLYFGGDGTTREALEMGCPVVSLPSRGLGSRWTASLYSLLGLPPSHHDDEHCSESSDSMDSSAKSHSSGERISSSNKGTIGSK